MIKLSKITYRRLLSQAQEAKDFHLDDLAEGVINALGPMHRDDDEVLQVSRAELQKEAYKQLWKIALDVIAYHNTNADIQKLGETLEVFAENLVSEIESSMGVEGEIGELEPKLPGESK